MTTKKSKEKHGQYPHQNPMLFAVILILFSPIGVDLFLPSTPEVGRYFSVSLSKVQWTISIFIFCVGLGQIPFGNLSDTYGRRPIALFGILLFIIGSLIGLLTKNFEVFLLARLMQGIGASATTVSSFSIIRDYYTGDQASNKFSWLIATLNFVPSIAPFIGALLVTVWSWRAGFVFFLGIGSIFLLWFFLKYEESANLEVKSKSGVVTFLKDARHVLHLRDSWLPGLICITGLSFIISYVSLAPLVLMENLGFSPIAFSLLYSLNAMMITIISFLVPKLNDKFGVYRMLVVGLFLLCTSSLILLFVGVYALMSAWYLYMIPISIGSIGFAFSFGNAQGIAMTPHGALIGTATGILGALQMSIASLIAAMMVTFDEGELVIFGGFFSGIYIYLFLSWFIKNKNRIVNL